MTLPLKGDKQYWITPWKPGPGGCTQIWGNPNTGYPGNRHNGIDLGCNTGTPIYAAWRGTVVKADFDPGYGRHVRILHPDGYLSIYGHFTQFYVTVGQVVAEGDYLGDSGGGLDDPMRGASDGPHLHFEVRSNPYVALSNIDPIAWLAKVEESEKAQDPLTGQVRVTATELLRARVGPEEMSRIIGKLMPGEIVQVAPGVESVLAAGIERVPVVIYVARGTRDDPWLTQV
jgi:hypothetical protein